MNQTLRQLGRGALCATATLWTLWAAASPANAQSRVTAGAPTASPALPVITQVGKNPCSTGPVMQPVVLDVLPRDLVRVCLSGALPEGADPEVAFGSKTAAARKNPDSSLTIEVPEQLAPGEYKLSVAVRDALQNLQPLQDSPVVRIFPVPKVSVADITPRSATEGTRIRVSGDGFLAPQDRVTLKLGDVSATVDFVSPDGKWFVAVVPPFAAGGQKPVEVAVWGVPATLPTDGLNVTLQQRTGETLTLKIIGAALLTLSAALALIYVLFRTLRPRRSLLGAVLLEPENDTYSLSRAQFFWWLGTIAFAYVFLFFGRGFRDNTWSFPPLSGFAYTFLISLGTLLLAQAANTVRGAKGAGSVHPSPSDLIVHGGVLAPERVQQVMWTALGSVAFLWIVVQTHNTAAGLPEIPPELLALMGISSLGYVGGKLVRQPGPIVNQVVAEPGSVILNVHGVHLSTQARVWVDGVEQPHEQVTVLDPDPTHPDSFARALRVELAGSTKLDEWFNRKHVVLVVNADAQRAEWRMEVPAITSAEIRPNGQTILNIRGEGIAPGATLALSGAGGPAVTLTPDRGQQNRWTAVIDSPGPAWVPGQDVDGVITNPGGERVKFRAHVYGSSFAPSLPPTPTSSPIPPAAP